MIKIRLSKNERFLLKILTILIILLCTNIFIINPINTKIKQLENDKQNILNIRETNNNKAESQVTEEDIMLKVQSELKNIAQIDYMDKKIIYDEYNNEVSSIEIKMFGNLDQIFKVQDIINKLELSRNLKYLELNTIQATDIESENIQEIIECIMQINVG